VEGDFIAAAERLARETVAWAPDAVRIAVEQRHGGSFEIDAQGSGLRGYAITLPPLQG
jgi:hypothetical protein